jgi:predicted transposase YbfD/YdcC
VEIRRLWVKKWAAEYVRGMLGIPDCRALIFLEKEIRHPKKGVSFETHHYISSLDPDEVSASEFQGYILQHWEVENCLHGVKDKEYAEDKHVCGSSWGEAWAVLTNMAVSLTNLLHQGERTLREVREKCCHDPAPTASKLGWKK